MIMVAYKAGYVVVIAVVVPTNWLLFYHDG